jgi:hypothetical protein
MESYTDLVLREMGATVAAPGPLRTVFFGGGVSLTLRSPHSQAALWPQLTHIMLLHVLY